MEAAWRGEASVQAVQQAPELFSGRRMWVEGLVVRTTRRAQGGAEQLSFLLRTDRGDTISVYDPEVLPEIGVRVQVEGTVDAGAGGVVTLGAGTAGLKLTQITSPAAGPIGDTFPPHPAPHRADACGAGEAGLIHSLSCSAGGALFRIGLGAGAGLLAGICAFFVVRRRQRDDDGMIPLVFGDEDPKERSYARTAADAPAAGAGAALDGATEPLFSDTDIERFNATVHGDTFNDPPVVPSTASWRKTIPVPGIVAEPPIAATPPATSEPPFAAEPAAVAEPAAAAEPWPGAEPQHAGPPAAVSPPPTEAEPRVVAVPEVAAPPPIPVGPPTAAKPAAIATATLPAPEASSDELVQLLPGRLEALEGPPGNPEVRFFRISSLEVPEITFGRSEGPPYRHVRLYAPTVSRTHARIRFAERRWKITNLSTVNPVVVNGVELRTVGEERTLSDGDRVQIGEYLFRYRDTRG